MEHYICTGDCKGISLKPGNCEAANCSRFGAPLRKCGEERKFSKLAAAIFALIALMSLLRLIFGWPAVCGNWFIPEWLSVVTAVAASALSYWGFRQ